MKAFPIVTVATIRPLPTVGKLPGIYYTVFYTSANNWETVFQRREWVSERRNPSDRFLMGWCSIVFCDDRHVIFKLGDIVLIYALQALPQICYN